VLAGRGYTDSGSRGELRFVTESVVSLEHEALVVDGAGVTGSRSGDSGGSLLAPHDATNHFEVVGVLSRGSASCTGLDEYTLVSAFTEWAEQVIQRGCVARTKASCGR
jgi:hypothetical protein